MDELFLTIIGVGVVEMLLTADRIDFRRTDNIAVFGGHRMAAGDIVEARLEVEQSLGRRDLTLVIESRQHQRLGVRLRRGDEVLLVGDRRDAFAEIVAASAIEIPRDKWDPKGKFARSGSPSHVTKAEALSLISNPPGPGEPLPIFI